MTMTQGQSTKTISKEVGFRDALGVAMAPVAGSTRSYYHFDMHAGSGENDTSKCSGSPKVAIEAADAYGITDYHFFFCDNDYAAMKQLIRRPWFRENERCYPVFGDNKDGLRLFAKFIRSHENPRFAVGSIIFDPNGWLNEINILHDFAAEFPNIVIIANGSVRTRLLIQSQIEKRLGKWKDKFNPDIESLAVLLSRKYWMVRDINYGGSGHGFVMVIGRNKPYEECEVGFHRLISIPGQRIVNKTRRFAVVSDGR